MLEFLQAVELDQDQTLNIAAAMKAVSLADGVNPREQQIIDSLVEGISAEIPPKADLSLFSTPDQRRVFMCSVVLVALADGAVSPEEMSLLEEYASQLDLGADSLPATIRQVGISMLSSFAGVHHFREQVQEIGETLGLSPEEIHRAIGGA